MALLSELIPLHDDAKTRAQLARAEQHTHAVAVPGRVHVRLELFLDGLSLLQPRHGGQHHDRHRHHFATGPQCTR